MTRFFYLIRQREIHRITHHYSAELQTAKQALATLKNLNLLTVTSLAGHLKVNRDKFAFIYHIQKCKNGKRLTITASSLAKIDQHDGLRPGTNQLQDWLNTARSRDEKKIITLLHVPTQIRFLLGEERVMCRGSRLTNSLG